MGKKGRYRRVGVCGRRSHSDFQRFYAAETRIALLARYFATLAIIISGLGLFGLAATALCAAKGAASF